MSAARILVTTASVASGAVIVAALVVVGSLLNEINGFYNEALQDMAEFKVFTTTKKFNT